MAHIIFHSFASPCWSVVQIYCEISLSLLLLFFRNHSRRGFGNVMLKYTNWKTAVPSIHKCVYGFVFFFSCQFIGPDSFIDFCRQMITANFYFVIFICAHSECKLFDCNKFACCCCWWMRKHRCDAYLARATFTWTRIAQALAPNNRMSESSANEKK